MFRDKGSPHYPTVLIFFFLKWSSLPRMSFQKDCWKASVVWSRISACLGWDWVPTLGLAEFLDRVYARDIECQGLRCSGESELLTEEQMWLYWQWCSNFYVFSLWVKLNGDSVHWDAVRPDCPERHDRSQRISNLPTPCGEMVCQNQSFEFKALNCLGIIPKHTPEALCTL